MLKKSNLQEGVTLYTRKSDQFKTVNFSVKWKSNLDEKNISCTCSTGKCLAGFKRTLPHTKCTPQYIG